MAGVVRALAVPGRGAAPAVTEVEEVEPGPGQLRVAVEAASVNGIDAATAAGHLWDLVPHAFPVVLGRDFAGTVAAAGPGVDLAPGTRVAGVITGMSLGTGALTGSVTVGAEQVAPLPDGVSAVDGAAVGLAGLTAVALVEALALTASDVLLVTGATGGVGVLTVQLAALTGAAVLATARPAAAAEVSGLGALATVDHTAGPDALATAVRAYAPHGLSALAHLAGDVAGYAALLAPGGRVASALGATADDTGRDDVPVTGVYAGVTPEKLGWLLDSLGSGRLRLPVAATYPLADAAAALADFGRPKVGKLVVTVP